MLWSFWRHRQLIGHLVKREIIGRYRGSFMGLTWSFLQPLLMLAIYTLVLGCFLKARWAGSSNSLEYSLVLFAGLIPFNFLADCLTRAPGLILSNPNYVKKIVFPLEVFAWVTVLAALFHTLLSLGAWAVFCLLVHGHVPWTMLYLPLLLLPLLLVTAGLCWFLGAAGVFIRDIGQVVGLAVQALMFLSPLFYSVKDVPPVLRRILLVNPLSFVIEQSRAVMIQGQGPDYRGVGIYWLASLGAAWLGFSWFQYTRDGFADVL